MKIFVTIDFDGLIVLNLRRGCFESPITQHQLENKITALESKCEQLKSEICRFKRKESEWKRKDSAV